jgi:hypothetical protein
MRPRMNGKIRLAIRGTARRSADWRPVSPKSMRIHCRFVEGRCETGNRRVEEITDVFVTVQ